ncbi:MAG: 50S ribosomal protein L23 [Candidatus Nanoarchaeia archaeon]|nr:50S ribosomal protein L23 [Candidatus Nanoarchaeia archaeon]
MKNVLKHIVTTEKSVRIMEAENKIIFVVDMKAKKPDIKKAIEETFDVKVNKINISITSRGLKKAYIQLKPESSAMDIATKFGLM